MQSYKIFVLNKRSTNPGSSKLLFKGRILVYIFIHLITMCVQTAMQRCEMIIATPKV